MGNVADDDEVEVDEQVLLDDVLIINVLVDETENVVVYLELVYGILDEVDEEDVVVGVLEVLDHNDAELHFIDVADDDELVLEVVDVDELQYSDTQQLADIMWLDDVNILVEIILSIVSQVTEL